jgi:hypothetical protein
MGKKTKDVLKNIRGKKTRIILRERNTKREEIAEIILEEKK